LGKASNNQAKALALYQGMNLLDARTIKSLIVNGGSVLMIKLMCNPSSLNDGKLGRII
jgi:riboflavin biosynthesis pyrimidine reductase